MFKVPDKTALGILRFLTACLMNNPLSRQPIVWYTDWQSKHYIQGAKRELYAYGEYEH